MKEIKKGEPLSQSKKNSVNVPSRDTKAVVTSAEFAVLNDILIELRQQTSLKSELWNRNDIGQFLKMSMSHVYGRILFKNNFPQPVVIPTTETGGAKRWYSKEVKDWVKKFRRVV